MKVLCVIDMQEDFISGSLCAPKAREILPAVKAKLDRSRQKGDTVIFTRDTHGEDYLQTQEGQKLPVVHCVKGSAGWEISKELDTENCKIIDKPSFGSWELAEYIAALDGVDEVELVGLCTDICVISNAILIKARLPEVRVCVDSACCAGVSVKSHRDALIAMARCQIEIR